MTQTKYELSINVYSRMFSYPTKDYQQISSIHLYENWTNLKLASYDARQVISFIPYILL